VQNSARILQKELGGVEPCRWWCGRDPLDPKRRIFVYL